MKLYIWKHRGALRAENFYPLSRAIQVGENVFYGEASHAFFKKKDAIKYLEELYEKDIRDNFELLTIDLNK